MLKVIQERVQRGAELLDQVEPGWAERIDLNNLDITSIKMCILGQVFGDYGFGLSRLRDEGHVLGWAEDGWSSTDHGFTGDWLSSEYPNHATWLEYQQAIEAEWAFTVKRHRGEPA